MYICTLFGGSVFNDEAAAAAALYVVCCAFMFSNITSLVGLLVRIDWAIWLNKKTKKNEQKYTKTNFRVFHFTISFGHPPPSHQTAFRFRVVGRVAWHTVVPGRVGKKGDKKCTNLYGEEGRVCALLVGRLSWGREEEWKCSGGHYTPITGWGCRVKRTPKRLRFAQVGRV